MRAACCALILCWSAFSCTGGEKMTIEISDLRDSEVPEVNTARHAPGDVAIYRSSYLGDTYAVQLYTEQDGEVEGYQTYIKSSQNFDVATYQWQDDATLHLILISSENGQLGKYSLTTDGGKVQLENFE